MNPEDLEHRLEMAYLKGKLEGTEEKVDKIIERQDAMDVKLDTVVDQLSTTRIVIHALKAFLLGAFALLGANADHLFSAIKDLMHVPK